jgi:hypothetical protein
MSGASPGSLPAIDFPRGSVPESAWVSQAFTRVQAALVVPPTGALKPLRADLLVVEQVVVCALEARAISGQHLSRLRLQMRHPISHSLRQLSPLAGIDQSAKQRRSLVQEYELPDDSL